MTAARLLAGFLYVAAFTVTPERARSLSPMEWADLIDAEHDLYLEAIGSDAGWVPGDDDGE